jgi:hypothetical protein
MVIDVHANGKPQKALAVARDDSGEVLAKDQGDPFSVSGRKKLAEGLCGQEKLKARAGRDEVERKLEEASDRATAAYLDRPQAPGAEGGPGSGGGDRLSQADKLVHLARGAELFHTPGGCDSEGYATVAVGDHRETWPVASNGFRRWLGKRFHDEFAKVPGGQALQDALNVLAGKAVHEGAEHEVAARVAAKGAALYLDLCDARWRAVEVTAAGWSVVPAPPVKFVRRRGMLPLPEPQRGGRLDELRPFLNLADDDSWVLAAGWAVCAFRPGYPFPVLFVNGEQGSAKTTACRALRSVIDPHKVPLRLPAREARDLMITATGGWVVAFDNLSGIPVWLSDALCCLATGAGFGTRQLYSDDEEKLFEAGRPVILNGIEDLAERDDLKSRGFMVTTATISDSARRTEAEFKAALAGARPRVLAGLLDAAAAALKNLPLGCPPRLPRMADAGAWVAAAEPALGWRPGTFVDAVARNSGLEVLATLENSTLYPALEAFLQGHPAGRWEGGYRDLLAGLEGKADEKTRRRRDWPASPRGLSGALRRLAPTLRKADWTVEFDRAGPKGARRAKLALPGRGGAVDGGGGRLTVDGGRGSSDRQPTSACEERTLMPQEGSVGGTGGCKQLYSNEVQKNDTDPQLEHGGKQPPVPPSPPTDPGKCEQPQGVASVTSGGGRPPSTVTRPAQPPSTVTRPAQPSPGPAPGGTGWDEAEAARLVQQALAARGEQGYSPDPDRRRRQGEAANAVDRAWLAKNLPALRAAVAGLVAEVGAAGGRVS